MIQLLLFLGIGMAVMLVLNFFRRKRLDIPLGKILAATLLLTAAGVLGTQLLCFVETGVWGGQSYFGAVFFVPLVFLPIAWLLRVPYGRIMDLCAPAECAMLAVMKINCWIAGCCEGRVLYYTAQAKAVYFPSQLAECLNAGVLMAVLVLLERKGRFRGGVYPLYMLLYGGTRLVLNSFRWGLTPFLWKLPAGHFWALCSMALGTAALLLWTSRRRKENRIEPSSRQTAATDSME